MVYILSGITFLILVGVYVFVREIKNAKEVDPTEPFLHDDPPSDIYLGAS